MAHRFALGGFGVQVQDAGAGAAVEVGARFSRWAFASDIQGERRSGPISQSKSNPDDTEVIIDVGIDAEALAAAITARVESGDIKVPPFPRSVMELNRLDAQDATFDAFVDVVARDPPLAARVLRVANSAAMGNKEPITTLAKAVRAVGITKLMRIALADSLVTQSCRDGPLVSHKDRAWRQAVTSALLASSLAPLRSLPAEQVFVCGLLHDFGRLIAVQVIEEIIDDGRVLAFDEGSDQMWSDLIDHHHIRLGEIVAESWLLPDMIQECITTHHKPLVDSPNQSLVQLLVGIDAVIELLERDPTPTRDGIADVSGLSDQEVEVVFQSLAALPQVISSFTIERLGRQARVVRESKVPAPSPTPTPPAAAPVDEDPSLLPGAPLSSSPAPVSTPAPSELGSTLASDLGSMTVPAPRPHSRVKAVAVASNRTFEVVSMTSRVVVLDGVEGLAIQQVFRVRFELALPLELWLRVIDSHTNKGRVMVSAMPFALTDADADAWRAQITAT